MADEPDPNEEEVLELTDTVEEPEGDEPDGDAVEDSDDPDAGEADEEVVVSFEDDETADQEGDSSVIRRLRERLRQAEREKAELRQAIPAQPAIEVGEKPTLAGCDYDEEAFETELDAWKQRKAAAEQQAREAEETQRKVQEAWERDLAAYSQRKAAIGIADYDEHEAAVTSVLNAAQQTVLVKAASDPAALVVALSRSPNKLAELAKFEDPIKMAAAIARMEGTVKVIKRKKGPEVDKPQSGSGALPGSGDAQLAKLQKEAERTGDYSKLLAHKRALRERGK